MSRAATHWRLLLAAALGIGLGVLAILPTPQMSELGRVFPITAGLIAIVAGIGIVIQAITRAADTRKATTIDAWRAGLLAATLLGWALLLDPLGFEISSAIALPAIAMITRREPMSLTSIAVHAAAGVTLVLVFSTVLSDVLNVRLP